MIGSRRISVRSSHAHRQNHKSRYGKISRRIGVTIPIIFSYHSLLCALTPAVPQNLLNACQLYADYKICVAVVRSSSDGYDGDIRMTESFGSLPLQERCSCRCHHNACLFRLIYHALRASLQRLIGDKISPSGCTSFRRRDPLTPCRMCPESSQTSVWGSRMLSHVLRDTVHL